MADEPGQLNTTELAAAQVLLREVNGLTHALHSLEYLERLPLLIVEREAQLMEVDQAVANLEQRERELRFRISQLETQAKQTAEALARAEAELMKTAQLLAVEQAQHDKMRDARELLRQEIRTELTPAPATATAAERPGRRGGEATAS